MKNKVTVESAAEVFAEIPKSSSQESLEIFQNTKDAQTVIEEIPPNNVANCAAVDASPGGSKDGKTWANMLKKEMLSPSQAAVTEETKDSDKGCTQSNNAGNPTISPPVAVTEQALAPKIDLLESSADNLDSTEQWQEVKRKHSSPADSKSILNPLAVPPNRLREVYCCRFSTSLFCSVSNSLKEPTKEGTTIWG
ncbi:hypothetical protein ACET3Z_000742 [Daucus carota]